MAVSRVSEEFGVLPREAAVELDNDADHLVLRVLVVRSFVECWQHRSTSAKDRPEGMEPMFKKMTEIQVEDMADRAAEREAEAEGSE